MAGARCPPNFRSRCWYSARFAGPDFSRHLLFLHAPLRFLRPGRAPRRRVRVDDGDALGGELVLDVRRRRHVAADLARPPRRGAAALLALEHPRDAGLHVTPRGLLRLLRVVVAVGVGVAVGREATCVIVYPRHRLARARPQHPADHLEKQGGGESWARQHDALEFGAVPPLGRHVHVAQHAGGAALDTLQDAAPQLERRLAVEVLGRDAGVAEGLREGHAVPDGAGEQHGARAAGVLLPLADDLPEELRVHRRRLERLGVVVAALHLRLRCVDGLVLPAAHRHQEALFAQLARRAREHVPVEDVGQAGAVEPPGRRGEPDGDSAREGSKRLPVLVVLRDVVRLVDEDEVDVAEQFEAGAQRLDGRDLHAAVWRRPGAAHDDAGPHAEAHQLVDGLLDELAAVREEEHAIPLALGARDDVGRHHRLAAAGGHGDEHPALAETNLLARR